MTDLYFKLKDNNGNIHDLELIESEITCDETEAKHKMTFKKENRFELRHMVNGICISPIRDLKLPNASNYLTKIIIYDNEKQLPLPFTVTDIVAAKAFCKELNELATIKQNNKPKPLKTEILEILSKIDEPQYEMANKIKKQKQHIKDLENKIRLLKRDNRSLQRNYCKKTTDLNQIKEERDYYEQKLMSWRENGYELP